MFKEFEGNQTSLSQDMNVSKCKALPQELDHDVVQEDNITMSMSDKRKGKRLSSVWCGSALGEFLGGSRACAHVEESLAECRADVRFGDCLSRGLNPLTVITNRCSKSKPHDFLFL